MCDWGSDPCDEYTRQERYETTRFDDELQAGVYLPRRGQSLYLILPIDAPTLSQPFGEVLHALTKLRTGARDAKEWAWPNRETATDKAKVENPRSQPRKSPARVEKG